MITQSINLNLVPGGVLPIINVSQYDKGSRTLQIVLFNGVTAYQIPEGSSVTIQGTKADKTGFQYEVDSFSGNVVTTDIEQQMTVFPGDVAIELSIAKNGARLGTANFILRVEPAALADDTIISETELPLIEQAVEIAEHIAEYVEICEDSAAAAAASASTASTKAGEASASATSAAGSATSASGSATAAAGSATSASDSASAASGSATAASGSASAASTSATNAATSETNASGSATSAAASATTASNAANEAHGWCDNNGDSGSAVPSATNNAYYWFTQAREAASGGDTVTWTQTQASGTKIAEINISGTSQNVYVPTAPTVNDGVLTIQQDGATVGTFSANQSGNTTVNLQSGPTYTEGDGIDITNNAIGVDTTFTEASTRANIASGDSLSTIWGKIKKFFTDLKAVAFSGAAADVTYDNGSVKDALDGLTGYGTNANGTYYKFVDGTLICTKVVTENISIASQWGALYETSNPVSFGDWAHSFISTPVASLTVASDAGVACVPERLSNVSASSAGESHFFRPTTGNGPLTVNLIAIGRWK